jgi:hypothetical protein
MFLDMDPKAQATKEEIGKSDYIKIKRCYRVLNNLHNGRKYSQTKQLITN